MPGIWPTLWLQTYGTEDTAGTWASAVQGVPKSIVNMALKRYTRVSQQYPPTPGQFYETCKEIRASLDARKKQDEPEKVTDRDLLWRYCVRDFAERLIGETARIVGQPWGYKPPQGFPVNEVVNGVKIDDLVATLNDGPGRSSAEAFKRFTERFDDAWAVYQERKFMAGGS